MADLPEDEDLYADNLMMAKLEMFCAELRQHFAPNRASLDCHILSCMCLKVYWLIIAVKAISCLCSD